MPASAAFVLALLAAAAMGLALQRGGTCMVAALDECIRHRRSTRLRALGEAALWVAAGVWLARWLGLQPVLPTPPLSGGWAWLGAALLGLGALVNGACVFGAIARLGTGQWAYLATPLGFYLGCLTVLMLQTGGWLPAAAPARAAAAVAVPDAAGALLALALLARVIAGLVQRRRRGGGPVSAQAATASIGVAFVLLLLLDGAWAYTDVLADLAHHGGLPLALPPGVGPRLALLVALLAGALAGGWATGQWQRQAPGVRALARCLAGGWLLGCGAALVPGGNDSLVLLGLPLLWPQAWLAVGVMCAVIAGVLALQARRGDQPGGRAQS